MTPAYRYRVAGIAKVIDGDTYDLDLDLGFYAHLRIRVRLSDVDTYELYGKNAHELGPIARDFAHHWLGTALEDGLTIETSKLNPDSPVGDGSFGRWAGRLTNAAGEDLGEELTARHLTKPHQTANPPQPGPCGDPGCPVLHADPANPIHPPND